MKDKQPKDVGVEKLARAERLDYLKKWRIKNKDRVRQYNATYWEKRAKKKLIEAKDQKD